jgi:hypothetical protein
MTQIKPITNSLDNAKPALVKADLVQRLDAFGQVLKNQTAQLSSVDQRAKAIVNFYEVHQRSQITGVPTSEYKAAVAALGLDVDKEPFAAIKLLQDNGFNTGAPSLEAILKYGAAPQVSGNQSYLAQVDEVNPNITPPVVSSTTESIPVQAQLDESDPAVVDQRADLTSVAQEIQALNEKFGDFLGPSKNYFEAVTHMSKQLDIAPYLSMTLDQALPKIAAALEANQLGMTTDRWLKGKVSS